MKNVSSISVKTFCFIFLCAICSIQAQDANNNSTSAETYAVAGTVLEDETIPLEGVNVVLKGSNEGVVTSVNGKFKFTKKLAIGDVLIFSYIGYQSQEYIINDSDITNQNISISFDSSDITLMGAVEVDGVYKSKKNIFQKFVGLFK